MKMALYLFIAFSAGIWFQKWDSKHGAYYGQKWGKATRAFFTDSKDAK